MPELLYEQTHHVLSTSEGNLAWFGRYNLKSEAVAHSGDEKLRGKVITRTKS
jgi:hypothetical protein